MKVRPQFALLASTLCVCQLSAQQSAYTVKVIQVDNSVQSWHIENGSVAMTTFITDGQSQHTVTCTPRLATRQLLISVATQQGTFQSLMPVSQSTLLDEVAVQQYDRTVTPPVLHYTFRGVHYEAQIAVQVPFEATLYADYFGSEVPLLAMARRGIDGFPLRVVRTDTQEVVWQAELLNGNNTTVATGQK